MGFYKNIVTNINEIKAIKGNNKISCAFLDKSEEIKFEHIKNEKMKLKVSLICSILEIINYLLIMVLAQDWLFTKN